VRVSTLAVELGVDPKDIRRFLRDRYGRVGTGGRWDLDPAQIEQVKWRFEGRGGQAIRERGGLSIPLLVRRNSGPEIVDKVNQLKSNPEDIHIKVEGSSEVLTFYGIIRSWSRRKRRNSSSSSEIVLLSNGIFRESGSFPAVQSYHLESQYCLVNRSGTYYAHHRNYVRALSEVQVPYWLVGQLVERSPTGRDDSPQELLISEYSQFLDSKLASSFILKWEHSSGRPIGDIQLVDLWGTTQEVKPVSRNRYFTGVPSDLRLSLSRYFATINLLKEHPLHSEAFTITLGEIFRRFHIEVGEKAEDLRRDVAERYGFEPYDGGWIKRKGHDQVTISSDLRVFINREFVCIESAKYSQLPLDDEVARRMLTVATAHRDQIYTIRGELKEAIERLFPIGGIT